MYKFSFSGVFLNQYRVKIFKDIYMVKNMHSSSLIQLCLGAAEHWNTFVTSKSYIAMDWETVVQERGPLFNLE